MLTKTACLNYTDSIGFGSVKHEEIRSIGSQKMNIYVKLGGISWDVQRKN